MNRITLAYTMEWPLTDLTYNADFSIKTTGAAPDGTNLIGAQLEFNPARLKTDIPEAEHNSGTLLGGRVYEDVLNARNSHEFFLQPKELPEAAVQFLKAFWTADFKYITIYENGSYRDYAKVSTGGGKLPLTRIEGNKYLPSSEMTLTEMEAI